MLAIYKEYYCSFCFVGQLLKMFYLSLNLKKPDFDSFLIVKMLKIHNFVAHDLMHVQLLIQKLKVLLKGLFMNILRNVASILSHFMHTLSHPWP